MGKQVTEEIVQSRNSGKNESLIPQHSESEIETDADHLENSYRNVLENANQTKARLEEQLNNWRKYRDVVQNNDKYLNTDLVEWWREKKYVDPQTVEDVNLNISQAEAIFQDLLARQAELKLSKSSCQSALLGSGSRKSFSVSDLSRNSSSTTPLSRLAQSVEDGLERNIEEIKKYIPKLEKTKQEWKSLEKEIEEFENWVKDKENTFESKIHKPSMKSSSLNENQRVEAERLKKEIDANEKHTNQLLEKARILGKRQFNPLLQRIEDLKRNLKKLLERRDEEIDAVDFVKMESVSCQNSVMQHTSSETIATQTPPETCTVSTLTLPMTKKSRSIAIDTKPLPPTPAPRNSYGLRNSGGNRGLSKMLYPYCCTSDLINQRAHLDFAHGAVLRDQRIDQNDRPKPTIMMSSKVRNGSEESVRRNFVAAQTFN